jgi:hypothetical protein
LGRVNISVSRAYGDNYNIPISSERTSKLALLDTRPVGPPTKAGRVSLPEWEFVL